MIDPFEMFKVLGVESRLRILELLKAKEPLGAKRIAEELDITPAAVSQHLKILKQAGFVKSERKGYYIPYSIDVAAMEHCRCILMEVCSCDCQQEGRHKRREPSNTSLNSMLKYKKELEKELKSVKERISKLKGKKR